MGRGEEGETPFREEMGSEALRADGVACPEPAEGYFRHIKMPQHYHYSFATELAKISED